MNDLVNIAWFLPRPKSDRYKGGMPLHCEKRLIQLAKSMVNKRNIKLLNLFCGMNKYGVRVDIREDVAPDYVHDAHLVGSLFPPETFDVILADPPYSDEESKELYGTGKINYKKWTSECNTILRPGGLLIVYHKYIMPNPDPSQFSVVKRVFVGTRTYHVPRIAIFFRKRPPGKEGVKLENNNLGLVK